MENHNPTTTPNPDQNAAATVKPVRRSVPRRLSPSAISLFQGCPKAFEYQYVLKTPGEDRPSPVLVAGNAIHHALQLFYGLPAEDRSLEVLHQALRSVWPQHRNAEAFLSREEEIECGSGALSMLTSFHDREDTELVPRLREDWASTSLPNGVRVFGRVDRVDDVDGGLRVVDYKTGRRAVSAKELPATPAAQVYALGIQDRFRIPVVELRLDYLALERSVSWYPTPEDLQRARENLTAITTGIRATELFEATPGDACRFCSHATICPDKDRVRLEDLTITEEVGF